MFTIEKGLENRENCFLSPPTAKTKKFLTFKKFQKIYVLKNDYLILNEPDQWL
jgi:hypothetical protein